VLAQPTLIIVQRLPALMTASQSVNLSSRPPRKQAGLLQSVQLLTTNAYQLNTVYWHARRQSSVIG